MTDACEGNLVVDLKQVEADRKRNAAVLLSTTGAAVAGIGLGALLDGELGHAAGTILAVGVCAHVVGMIGNRRAQLATGHQFSWWEVIAFWLCSAAIAVLGGFVILSRVGPA